MQTSVILMLLALLASTANAHIRIETPAPRRATNNPGPGDAIDYDLTSPLGKYPCKGHSKQKPVLTVKAGDSIPMVLTGTARKDAHDGGHCQFALSYDNDKTFVVIDTIIRECLRREFPFKHTLQIPANAPAGEGVTLSWLWYNAVGNRELYNNCVDINIENPNPNAVLSGPEPLLAHIPGAKYHFPEFPGNSDDKREFFNEPRAIVTFRGTGQPPVVKPPTSSAPASSASTAAPRPTSSSSAVAPRPTRTSSAAPRPTQTRTSSTVAPRPTRTVTPAPKPTKTSTATATQSKPPTRPTPTSTTPDAPCKDGQMRCAAEGKKIGSCTRGRWVDMDVAPGTKCKSNGDGQAFLAFAYLP
ncbi:hypothetical protein H9P43_001935 [Blastocladiella emersonii ATCC 22665]|nr:hypothetical protein H9P43_001935 [Blastocladiella emersonii ATCC 22665]